MMKFKKARYYSNTVIFLTAFMFLFIIGAYASSFTALRVPIGSDSENRGENAVLSILHDRLSSRDPIEIDSGLRMLKDMANSGIFSAQALFQVIEDVFIVKKTKIISRTTISGYELTALVLEPGQTYYYQMLWSLYDDELDKILRIVFNSDTAFVGRISVGESLENSDRILSLVYWWMALNPGLQSKFSGWDVQAKGANYLTTRVLFRNGPFTDPRVVETDGSYFRTMPTVIPITIGHTAHGPIELLPREPAQIEITDIKIGPRRYDLSCRFPAVPVEYSHSFGGMLQRGSI